MGVAEPNTAFGGVPATLRLRDSFCPFDPARADTHAVLLLASWSAMGTRTEKFTENNQFQGHRCRRCFERTTSGKIPVSVQRIDQKRRN